MPRKSSKTLGRVLSWFACRKCTTSRKLSVHPSSDGNSTSLNSAQLEIPVPNLVVEQAVKANPHKTDPQLNASSNLSFHVVADLLKSDPSVPSLLSSHNSEAIDTTPSEDHVPRPYRLAMLKPKLLMLCDIPTRPTGPWYEKVCQIRSIRVMRAQLPHFSRKIICVNAFAVITLFFYVICLICSTVSITPRAQVPP